MLSPPVCIGVPHLLNAILPGNVFSGASISIVAGSDEPDVS